jgi:hypothetical protein
MSANGGIPSKTQQWFRDYSHRLASSYRSSGLIEHSVTKGGAREQQILTFLENLLPKSCEVEPNTVILDSKDREPSKFDGAILNLWTWPLLLEEGGVKVAPFESVVVAFETKSSLDREEIAGIFTKAYSLLRELIVQSGRSSFPTPKTAVFAYSCTNPNLAFLDYATSVHKHGFHSPNSICILGSAVMGLARGQGNTITFTEDWQSDSFPEFVKCDDDALLLFFYLVSFWASISPDASSGFLRYVKTAFSRVKAFHFDRDFLDSLAEAPANLEAVRDVFKRRASTAIEVLYEEARRTGGGPPSNTGTTNA